MEPTILYQDRRDAGRRLAEALHAYEGRQDTVVLALPRGGVPVAYEVAQILNAPLDVFLVRKLGVPGHEELAMGAIASGGIRVLNRDIVDRLAIPARAIDQVVEAERRELERREQLYRGDQPPLDVRGKIVILIDDGLATGASMRAAVAGLKAHQPGKIVVAVPTASIDTCEEFKRLVDEIVCAATPEPFHGVGAWYNDFSQTSDEEVSRLLQDAGSTST
jgi:predicted phosphoribosyltransferase